MRHSSTRRSRKAGLPPGTLVHIGDRVAGEPVVSVIAYGPEHYEERVIEDTAECARYEETGGVAWINVDGIHKTELVEDLGRQFKLHPLMLEDIVNANQRPKLEDYGERLYVVLKMIDYDEKKKEVRWEQVSLVLGPHFLLSFQEPDGDVFQAVRERLRSGKGRLRTSGPDYLLYALMDVIVDHYFLVLEKLGEIIEFTEEDLVSDPSSTTLQNIHTMKTEMIFLRKCVWPLREVLARLERWESGLVHHSTAVFFRDVYDHTIQVIDTVETYREMISGMLDIYLSSVSNRMNAIMKVLTLIATIFMPLTFLAGVYGMNFKHMPELDLTWTYPALWGTMITIALSMLWFFRRKEWL